MAGTTVFYSSIDEVETTEMYRSIALLSTTVKEFTK